MRQIPPIVAAILSIPGVLLVCREASADRIEVPSEVSVDTWGRALVRAVVRDDGGSGLEGVAVEFRVEDPSAATFDLTTAFTDREGAAFTVVATRPNDFEDGNPRVLRTTFTASSGDAVTAPVPIFADALAVDGVIQFSAPPLPPFRGPRQVLVGFTPGGFLRPEDLVGFHVNAWSIDPRVAEIGEGLVTGVDGTGTLAVVEFPVTARRDGVATFIIGFLDLPTYTTSIVILDRLAFRRGDCNGDRRIDLSDAVCLLEGLFAGRELPGCLASVNLNGDGRVDISDPTYLLNHLFLGGPPPPPPFPDCGEPQLDADERLGCERSAAGCE